MRNSRMQHMQGIGADRMPRSREQGSEGKMDSTEQDCKGQDLAKQDLPARNSEEPGSAKQNSAREAVQNLTGETAPDLNLLQKRLQALGYTARVFKNRAEAAEWINRETDRTTVGIGGCVTAAEMGLYESLSRHNQVISHWHIPEGKTDREMRDLAMNTEVYLTSANAVSLQGEIINIDYTGNRAASVFYGHRRVIFVIGRNKIEPNFAQALWRARNIASPKNAQRLGRKTPCAVRADRCYNCSSPDRICNGLQVLWHAMAGAEMEVILINEDLGY